MQNIARPKVSVVVPIYNTAKYLPKCLESIIMQSYNNLEIFCFVDASPDNSIDIARYYAAKDGRIKVIDSLTNVKQGGDFGLLNSSAKYIVFIDSDDWVEPDYIQKLLQAIICNKADIAYCDYNISNNGKVTEMSPLGNCNRLPINEIKTRIATHGTPIWTGIYRKDHIIDNGLLFPEKIFFEDNAVAIPIGLSASVIAKVDEPLYFYRNDNISTLRNRNNNSFFDRLTTAHMMVEHCKRLNLYNDFKSEIDRSFLNIYFRNTISGIFDKFDNTPYSTINNVKQCVLKTYGWRCILKYIYIHKVYLIRYYLPAV